MPYPLLRQRRQIARVMLCPEPLVFLLHPYPLLLLRFSRLQPSSLGLKQRVQHTNRFLARRQRPAKFPVKRTHDLPDLRGVGRGSPVRSYFRNFEIVCRACVIFVLESLVVFGSAGECGLDADCAAVGLQERGLQ